MRLPAAIHGEACPIGSMLRCPRSLTSGSQAAAGDVRRPGAICEGPCSDDRDTERDSIVQRRCYVSLALLTVTGFRHEPIDVCAKVPEGLLAYVQLHPAARDEELSVGGQEAAFRRLRMRVGLRRPWRRRSAATAGEAEKEEARPPPAALRHRRAR
eukprot:scaffold272610_cov32-Tisochrysis_lutea.AAC.1